MRALRVVEDSHQGQPRDVDIFEGRHDVLDSFGQVPLAAFGCSPSDIAKQTITRTLVNLFPTYQPEKDRNGSPLIR